MSHNTTVPMVNGGISGIRESGSGFLKSLNSEIPFSQIFRSGTSIGANLNEARHPQSDADFLSKANIALKEARETEYWLNLLHDNGYLNDDQFNSLSHDCTRIVKIQTSIVKTMREKIDNKKKSLNQNHLSYIDQSNPKFRK